MKKVIRNAIRLLVVMALLLTSAVVFAQDDTETTDTAIPFVGIRFMEADDGVLVTGIITNTPAATVGLQASDVITAVNDGAVTAQNVQEAVWSHDVDDTVTLTINREGQEVDQDVTLMARPVDLFDNPLYEIPMDPSSIGLIVGDFDGKLMVLGTVAGSQAEIAGFEVSDVVTRVDGDLVDTIGEAAIAMSDLSDGDTVEFYLTRGDEELVIEIVIDRRRRRPRPRPRPRDITTTYETSTVTLGYGDNFIEVQDVTSTHDLYLAGIREGDFIVAVNGSDVNDMNNLFADGTIDLTVERDTSMLSYNVPTSVAPLLMFGLDTPLAQEAGEWIGLHEKQVTLGVRYIQLEETSPYFDSSDASNGAFIAEVIEGLPAHTAGIQVGDIIVAIDDADVTLDIDLRNRVYAHHAGDTVTLEILRNGNIIELNVTLRVATS